MRNLAFAAFLGLVACGGKGPADYSAVESAATSDSKAQMKIEEGDALWAERGDADKLASALAVYEEAVSLDPDNRHAYERLVRGWYFYGDGHTDDVDTKVERWGVATSGVPAAWLSTMASRPRSTRVKRRRTPWSPPPGMTCPVCTLSLIHI